MTLKARLLSAPGMFDLPATLNLQARGPMVAFDRAGEGGGAAADDGPLSEADALNLLTAAEEEGGVEDDADAADGEDDAADADGDDDEDVEASADDDEDTGDDASDQEAADDDAPEDDPASEEDGEDEGDEPDEPAIDAPKFWSAEEKAVFATAPRNVQMLVAAKDAEYSRQVSLAKEDAAAARKDASIISEIGDKLEAELERSRTIFQGKWDGVDWAQWAKENPQEAFQAKLEYDQEQEELQRQETAAAATQAEARRQFLKDETAKLKEMGHVLADPEKGKAEKAKLVAYAESQGRTAADLAWAGAWELSVLHKAMLWDELQAKAAATPRPVPAKRPEKAAPAKAPAAAAPKAPGHVRPSAAAPPRRNVIQRRRTEVIGRALRTGRQDDALAALEAIGE